MCKAYGCSASRAAQGARRQLVKLWSCWRRHVWPYSALLSNQTVFGIPLKRHHCRNHISTPQKTASGGAYAPPRGVSVPLLLRAPWQARMTPDGRNAKAATQHLEKGWTSALNRKKSSQASARLIALSRRQALKAHCRDRLIRMRQHLFGGLVVLE